MCQHSNWVSCINVAIEYENIRTLPRGNVSVLQLKSLMFSRCCLYEKAACIPVSPTPVPTVLHTSVVCLRRQHAYPCLQHLSLLSHTQALFVWEGSMHTRVSNTCPYCPTHKYSVTHHSVSCTLAPWTTIMECVMSLRLLQLKVTLPWDSQLMFCFSPDCLATASKMLITTKSITWLELSRVRQPVIAQHVSTMVPTTVWGVGRHVAWPVWISPILGDDCQVVVTLGLPVKGWLGTNNGGVAGDPRHYLKVIIGSLKGKG